MGRTRESTNEQFDEKLAEIIDQAPASHLLSIPGVYEVLSEHFNNDVLQALDNAAEDEQEYLSSSDPAGGDDAELNVEDE